MNITRRFDYACRIIRAAYYAGDRYRSVSEIAEEEGIPYAFARSIQHELVQAGVVTTVRGARGGLKLNCDPEKTTVADLIETVLGSISLTPCTADPQYCEKSKDCEYNHMWEEANEMLRSYFSKVTLASLLTRKGEASPASAEKDSQKDDQEGAEEDSREGSDPRFTAFATQEGDFESASPAAGA